MARVLFVLKKRPSDYNCPPGHSGNPGHGGTPPGHGGHNPGHGHHHCYDDITLSSGLYNSCRFVANLLKSEKVDSKVVIVVDNNEIDREVYNYKPTHVIIEALWVVPSKFDVLKKLHPKVEWIIRLHSNSPFIATEGIAFAWIYGYLQKGLKIAANHELMYEELRSTFPEWHDRFIFLPNYYPLEEKRPLLSPRHKAIKKRGKALVNRRPLHIGCFGAIRPLKNQFIQALAAIQFANRHGWHLHFHINAARVERGDEVLKNLRALFKNSHHHLVEHDWMPHREFLELVRRMDVSMQVSFSETFNIVTADAVGIGVPVVVSDQVEWVSNAFKANPNHANDIAQKIYKALNCRLGPYLNYWGLVCHNKMATKKWAKYFGGIDISSVL